MSDDPHSQLTAHCLTFSRSHCLTVSQFHVLTVSLSHNFTLSHIPTPLTVSLSYCLAVSQSHTCPHLSRSHVLTFSLSYCLTHAHTSHCLTILLSHTPTPLTFSRSHRFKTINPTTAAAIMAPYPINTLIRISLLLAQSAIANFAMVFESVAIKIAF